MRRLRTAGYILLAVLFVRDMVAFQMVAARGRHDLNFWCNLSAQVAREPGLAIYAENPRYLYPPFFLLLMRPLSVLPVPAAALLFEGGKWLALWYCVRALSRMLGAATQPNRLAALVGVVLAWRFISNDLSQGNVNLFVLAAVLCACSLLTRGRDMLAGAMVGLAVCVKLTPALLIVYFLYKGWWRTVVGATAAAALGLLVLPGLWMGGHENTQALASWHRHVVLSFVQQGEVYSIHINQSLTAILKRLLSDTIAIEPDKTITLSNWSWPAIDHLRRIIGAVLVAGVGYACRGRFDPRRQPLALLCEVGLVLIVMLLLSGYSWKAHFATLLVGYAVLAAWWLDRSRAGRGAVGAAIAASFALCTLTSDLIGPRGADYAEAYGLIALGAIAAGVGLIRVRAVLRRPEAPSSIRPEGDRVAV